jgi:hypothetical protein
MCDFVVFFLQIGSRGKLPDFHFNRHISVVGSRTAVLRDLTMELVAVVSDNDEARFVNFN